MNNVKRKVFTGAFALLLAASVSAGASSKAFAAQKSEEKAPKKYIQGYLVKDGKKTPVYSDSNKQKSDSKTPMSAEDDSSPYAEAYPKLPEDPYAPAPQTGNTITQSGDIGEIIYFEGERFLPGDAGEGGKKGKFYLEKKTDGQIEIGAYDPETLKIYPDDAANSERAQNGEEWMVEQYGPDYAWSKAFDGTSKLKRETQFELIRTGTPAKTGNWGFNESVKSGVQTWQIQSFTSTIGSKITAEAGLQIGDGKAFSLGGKVTTEMSASLSETFQENIVITDEKTVGTDFSIGPVNNPDYKYDVFRGAAYQLTSKYTLVPGDGLKKLMEEAPELKGLASPSSKYNEVEMYYPVTPGSHQ
ncbi:hypothetical protein SAMN05444487_103197 [Marininema mesophilum]|uniref:WxL domain-containing protein n=1 Tax=Marininema mesophilum TaxID=1048340 RepID=A0A1H2TQD0_9BACL|nr:hypothetical protein [Marininema mesophilum]SDW45494.1 hypothetical protein SAMN05444487_103197 [Marininema mesophilum]